MFYIVYKHLDGTSSLEDVARVIEAPSDTEADAVVRTLQYEAHREALKPYKVGTKPPKYAYIARFDKAFFTRAEAVSEMKGAFSHA